MMYPEPDHNSESIIKSALLVNDSVVILQFTTTAGFTTDNILEKLMLTNKSMQFKPVDVQIEYDQHTVYLIGDYDINYPTHISLGGATYPVIMAWQLKDELYQYDGPLGAFLYPDGTADFYLWAPSAEMVTLVLYDKDNPEIVIGRFAMARRTHGVWHSLLNSENTSLPSVRGFYYQFEILRDGQTYLTLDPYAQSMAAWASDTDSTIGKGAIVNAKQLGPKLDFASIQGYETREDAIIYEIHVRDFTSDPDISETLQAEFGTFASFIEKLDYIKNLGVTHIQLLPVMSYYFIDELNRDRILNYTSANNNYNWGYDPHSYFSLSGMYSQDPRNPELRIIEFKNLIQEIHNRGMGVTMDVVYNHTAQMHILEDIEPNYYHFMNLDASPRESFGGGRLGTTHAMSRRLLIDSICYFTEVFKIDGFRFDMMGDHDATTIQNAFDAAKAINPNVLMIGEGWLSYAGDEGIRIDHAADQQWMQYTQAVGSFSDEMRNELKSGYGSEGQPRFLTGGARNIHTIYDNLIANPSNFYADDPGDVVNYIAAHDNLTLHDVLAQSIRKDPKFYENEILQRQRLGNLMILTAQGTAFLHAGQEYGRTKQILDTVSEIPYKSTMMHNEDGTPFENPYFVHDSYQASDLINRFEWRKVTDFVNYPEHVKTMNYTAGLIALRKSTHAFTHATKEAIHENVRLISSNCIGLNDLVIAYSAYDPKCLCEYLVVVNADSIERYIDLSGYARNLSNGTIIADRTNVNLNGLDFIDGVLLKGQTLILDPLTATIIRFHD